MLFAKKGNKSTENHERMKMIFKSSKVSSANKKNLDLKKCIRNKCYIQRQNSEFKCSKFILNSISVKHLQMKDIVKENKFQTLIKKMKQENEKKNPLIPHNKSNLHSCLHKNNQTKENSKRSIKNSSKLNKCTKINLREKSFEKQRNNSYSMDENKCSKPSINIFKFHSEIKCRMQRDLRINQYVNNNTSPFLFSPRNNNKGNNSATSIGQSYSCIKNEKIEHSYKGYKENRLSKLRVKNLNFSNSNDFDANRNCYNLITRNESDTKRMKSLLLQKKSLQKNISKENTPRAKISDNSIKSYQTLDISHSNETKNLYIPIYDIFLPQYENSEDPSFLKEKEYSEIYTKHLRAHMKKISDCLL